MLQIYLVAIAVFSILIGIIPIGAMAQDNSNDNSNDPRNQACYNAGFADGRQNNPYSQKMVSQCGVNGGFGPAYHQGFLSGCISGQGKDYFSCQQLTNSPVGGSNSNGGGGGGNGNGGGGGGNGNGGGGGGGGGNGNGGGGGG
jgi:hypothetical protein